MKLKFKNRLKVWLHQFLSGLFHDFVISKEHVFCTCGYGDTRPQIEGVHRHYRRIVDRAAYADENLDIPN